MRNDVTVVQEKKESKWQTFKKVVCPKMWGKAPVIMVMLAVVVTTAMMPTTCFAA